MLSSTTSEIGSKIVGDTPICFEDIFIIYTHTFKTTNKAKYLHTFTTFEFQCEFLNQLLGNTNKPILRRRYNLGYLQIFLIIVINIFHTNSHRFIHTFVASSSGTLLNLQWTLK